MFTTKTAIAFKDCTTKISIYGHLEGTSKIKDIKVPYNEAIKRCPSSLNTMELPVYRTGIGTIVVFVKNDGKKCSFPKFPDAWPRRKSSVRCEALKQ